MQKRIWHNIFQELSHNGGKDSQIAGAGALIKDNVVT